MKKYISIALLFILTGCGREPMSYSQAKLRFAAGMSPKEVEAIFGKPLGIDSLEQEIYWDYLPERRLRAGPKGAYSGFSIIFEKGKTVRIVEHQIIKD